MLRLATNFFQGCEGSNSTAKIEKYLFYRKNYPTGLPFALSASEKNHDKIRGAGFRLFPSE